MTDLTGSLAAMAGQGGSLTATVAIHHPPLGGPPTASTRPGNADAQALGSGYRGGGMRVSGVLQAGQHRQGSVLDGGSLLAVGDLSLWDVPQPGDQEVSLGQLDPALPLRNSTVGIPGSYGTAPIAGVLVTAHPSGP